MIRFGTTVASVEPIATGAAPGSRGWTVTLGTGERIDYDGVFVANGHLWDQKVPSYPGSFAGKQLHSGSFRNTDDLVGDRVLVVGAGNSGADMAADVAQHRIDVDIVIREGLQFQPKSYFGVPRAQVGFLADFSADEQDLIARLLARVSIGQWKDYPGMPEPRARTLAEGRVDRQRAAALLGIQHGRIRVVPGIESLDGSTVRFVDGPAREYDTILWATGFHASLPFLDPSLVQRRNDVPLRYAAGVVPAGLEKLYYIGLAAPRGPQIPVYGVQAKLAIGMVELHEAAGEGGAGMRRIWPRSRSRTIASTSSGSSGASSWPTRSGCSMRTPPLVPDSRSPRPPRPPESRSAPPRGACDGGRGAPCPLAPRRGTSDGRGFPRSLAAPPPGACPPASDP